MSEHDEFEGKAYYVTYYPHVVSQFFLSEIPLMTPKISGPQPTKVIQNVTKNLEIVNYYERLIISMSHSFVKEHVSNLIRPLLLWLYSPLLGLGRVFSFLILYTEVRTPCTGDQPVARPLPTHRTTQTQNKRTQYRYPCLESDSKPGSRRSSEKRQFMP
jgi:hypothetical protein